MLDRRRHEVTALAARAAFARERGRVAEARLARATSRWTARPAMLLLPFAAGAVGTALITRRHAGVRGTSAPEERRARAERREKIAWASLFSSAMTLWNTTRPLRESLQDPRTRQALTDSLAGLRERSGGQLAERAEDPPDGWTRETRRERAPDARTRVPAREPAADQPAPPA